MGRFVIALMVIALGSFVLAEEPATTGRSNEAIEILKKSAAAMKNAETVTYRAEYDATGWLQARVQPVEGTVVMGEQSKHKINPFFCEIKIKPREAGDTVEVSAGCDGDNYLLIDPTVKTCYMDKDQAVLGAKVRNFMRVQVAQFSEPNPYEDIFKSGNAEFKGETKVGDEDCYELLLTPSDGGRVSFAISKKDFLPRRFTRLIKRDEGEATTVLTIHDLVVNPTFVRNPFELRCPEGFKQTDDFAP